MNKLYQFLLLSTVAFIGQLMNILIPLPAPGSVWGMALLFALLCLRVVRLEWVEDAADYVIAVLPVCFVPAMVAIMDDLGLLAKYIVPVVLCCVGATFVTFLVSGRTAVLVRRLGGRHD